MASRDKDPRRSLHVEEVPTPELGPGEALVAVMASAINYNTVWTSIFEPVSTFGFLERYGRRQPAGQAARPALPRRRLRPGRRRAAHRARRARLEARRRGGRALPVGRAREPRRPQRHDDGPRAADLGLRDQLRRPGRARAGQGQPADAQAGAPDLGGGRRPRAGELHRVPPAGLPQRRRHEAGRHRADLGRAAAASASYATQIALNGGAIPVCVVSSDGEGRDLPRDGRRADHRPRAEAATGSGRTSTPRTPRSGSASASGSAS